MTKELLDEAYQLCQKLEKLCWNAAIKQDKFLYERYNKVEQKSWNRYERRFKNYQSNN